MPRDAALDCNALRRVSTHDRKSTTMPDKQHPEDQAFDEGASVAKNGGTIGQNPYDEEKHPGLHTAWRDGWSTQKGGG